MIVSERSIGVVLICYSTCLDKRSGKSLNIKIYHLLGGGVVGDGGRGCVGGGKQGTMQCGRSHTCGTIKQIP